MNVASFYCLRRIFKPTSPHVLLWLLLWLNLCSRKIWIEFVVVHADNEVLAEKSVCDGAVYQELMIAWRQECCVTECLGSWHFIFEIMRLVYNRYICQIIFIKLLIKWLVPSFYFLFKAIKNDVLRLLSDFYNAFFYVNSVF